MTGQDYYTILGITPDASSEEIKKAYKALAFKYHPDRNLENREVAEEKFKELTEAYGVLIDSQKRRQYDHLRFSQNTQQQFASRYASSEVHFENLFKDMFSNPNASKVFHDLEQEFRRHGIRFDKSFFENMFFGGKGVFFGGFFFFGPSGFQGTFHKKADRKKKSIAEKVNFGKFLKSDSPKKKRQSLIEKITHKLEDLTYKHLSPSEEIFGPRDLSFNLTIPAKDGPKGTEVRIAYNCNGKTERLRVRIPPINRSGVQLRLPEKGRQDANGCLGDLYLRVYLKYD